MYDLDDVPMTRLYLLTPTTPTTRQLFRSYVQWRREQQPVDLVLRLRMLLLESMLDDMARTLYAPPKSASEEDEHTLSLDI